MKGKSSVKWLWKITGIYKLYILALVFIQAVLGINAVVYALFLRNIIDSAVAGDMSGFRLNMIKIISLVIINLILRAAARYFEENSRSTFENILKDRLFSCLMKKDYASVTSVHSGEWINRLTNDTVVTASALTEILPGMGGMVIKLTGALIMLLTLTPQFAFLLFPCGMFLILMTYVFRKKLKKLHKNIQEKDGSLRTYMQERLGGLIIVRTFSAEEKVKSESRQKMQAHKSARMKRNHFSNICNIGFGAAMNGMYLFGVGFCGFGLMNGTVSYGTLTAVLQLISQIQSPFANITGYLPKFYAMTASAERLMEAEEFDDYCKERLLSDEEIHNFYENRFAGFEFENAGFTYISPVRKNEAEEKTGMPVVIKNLSIMIKKGEFVAFTGQSGCGKSTLLKLLMCLYSLDEGKRYIVTESEKIDLTSEWSRFFAYVPQGNQLMSGSVRDIITLSSDGGDTENFERALKISCAYEFVNELENGPDTLLGERGAGLSEGQMQRIAIARAVYSDNPVLLFDESTSALDEETEKKVLQNLKKLTDKTVLIVTHRPAALDICDTVINFSGSGIETEKKI